MSPRVLNLADVVATVGLGTGWAVMIYFDRLGQHQVRAELVALLATSYTLATRAGLVPSTEIVLSCLAKKPADRSASAAALADMLERCKVPTWTREDAREFWARAVPARSGLHAKSAEATEATETTDSASVPDTVVVALDDRGAA